MDRYDFPITSSTLAVINFTLAIIAMIFFKLNSHKKTKVLHTNSEKQGATNVVCSMETGIVELPTSVVKKIHEDDIVSEKF